MGDIIATYRHSEQTAAPDRLTIAEIWSVARSVRSQLVTDGAERKLQLEQLPDRMGALVINEVAFSVAWDLEHAVRNRAGVPVMGVTEYDRASPDCIMVSVNGPRLSANETLLRSTIAHELGHVVFDAPGWIRTAPAKAAYAAVSGTDVSRDPRELRANEFMGALLVPSSLVRIDLQRQAKRRRLPVSPRPSSIAAGTVAYDATRLDPDAVDEVIFALADQYGVSESFLQVRLDRYDLLRTSRARKS